MDAAMNIRGGGASLAAAAPFGSSPKKLLSPDTFNDYVNASIISSSSGCSGAGSTWKADFLHSQVCTTNKESSATRRMSSWPTSMKKKKVTFKTEQPSKPYDNDNTISNKPPSILNVGCDVMANILSFLEPPETLQVVTMPLCKDWIQTFTNQDEQLWRTLCVEKPFHAIAALDDDDDDETDDAMMDDDEKEKDEKINNSMKFRIMYTSFVRCMRYLQWIKDAQRPEKHGCCTRQDSDTSPHVVPQAQPPTITAVPIAQYQQQDHLQKQKRGLEQNVNESLTLSNKKPRYAKSSLTDRLLLLPRGGEKKTTTTATIQLLPWSCAVYSIVNWMVAFPHVEGIQIQCLETLPILLEHEQQRITAQRAGLGHVILRTMLAYPTSAALHTACFHALVLLARPIGGQEGMLFKSRSMTTTHASEIFVGGTAAATAVAAAEGTNSQLRRGSDGGEQQQQHGIGILLDSMHRFQDHEMLQAMACWSLVNLALIPEQRKGLVQRGAIQVITRAMKSHSSSAQVQHRALFALVNLVIPSSNTTTEAEVGAAATAAREQSSMDGRQRQQQLPLRPQPQQQVLPEDDDVVNERALLDESVQLIVQLIVLAMRNFCSSPEILNRACLVLRNLSLISDYHHILLFTPHCYEMLQYSATNFGSTDRLLHASASGTLRHLQMYLRNSNEIVRARFHAFHQEQQWSALELAYREAASLNEQGQRLLLLREQEE